MDQPPDQVPQEFNKENSESQTSLAAQQVKEIEVFGAADYGGGGDENRKEMEMPGLLDGGQADGANGIYNG